MKNSRLNMSMKENFKVRQHEFASYIRDPDNNPAPADVNKQRMDTYRELFFNNIDNFLGSNFPVLRTLLNDSQWFALRQDFFANHVCHSPYFSEIPEEFLDYLQNERVSSGDFPFTLELAHYEWVEMALSIAKETGIINKQTLDDPDKAIVGLSPLAWPLVYQYPVHKISPAFLPAYPAEQPTFLLVYRNENDDVNFMEITPVTYRLLEIIQENQPILAKESLRQVAEESNYPNPEIIIAKGLQILKELADKNIITVSA
jgi:hypothetical protein